jgi:HK97 family phage major capsid protein/HK97 family phage prohead protease
MARATLKVRPQNRAASFDLSSIDVEKRTVRLSFASPEPVKRYFGNEVLGFTDGECDLSRLNNGAALLLNHDTNCQIGVVESAEINGERGYATVRFSSSAMAQDIFKDVQDGIRTKVSVGYNVNGARLIETEGDESTYRITSWQPYEVSIVSVPADDSVGVGRGAQPAETEIPLEIPETMKRILHDAAAGTAHTGAAGGGATAAPTAHSVSADDSSVAKRNSEIGEILAIGHKFNRPQEEIRAFVAGKSLEEYRKHVLSAIGATALPTSTITPSEDMTRAIGKYSIVRALRVAMENNGRVDGLEGEFDQELRKNRRGLDAPKGFLIPEAVMLHRTLTTGAFATGGALVQTTVDGSQYVEYLRNRTVVEKLGARMLSGLVGNLAIPRGTSAATAYWLADGASGTVSDLNLGQVALSPHKLVAISRFTKDLMAQASLDVEGLVRDDLMKQTNLAIDLAALAGTGVGGQPLGVANIPTAETNTVTFGAAATWAKVLSFETKVAQANADTENMAFVTSPNTREKWKTNAKIGSTFPNFIWDVGTSPGEGRVNGYRALVTNQVGSSAAVADQVLFGNWADLILARWAGIDVVVNPYTDDALGAIKITLTQWFDVAARHGKSFCRSTDSGAQ